MQLKLQICRSAATPQQRSARRHKASNRAANEAYAQFFIFSLYENIAYNKNEIKNHFKFPFLHIENIVYTQSADNFWWF